MSGLIGGDAFRAAWAELRRVMLADPDARIIEEVTLRRTGSGAIDVSLRLRVDKPHSAGAGSSESIAIS